MRTLFNFLFGHIPPWLSFNGESLRLFLPEINPRKTNQTNPEIGPRMQNVSEAPARVKRRAVGQ